MWNKFVCTFVLLVLIGDVKDCTSYTSRTIPDYLINCYSNGGTQLNTPHNVQLLVEIISKIEKANVNSNIRMISSSLLHRLRIDGIERAPNVKETENVIPFRASAFQYIKFSFLLDLLIPGTDIPNIMDGLNQAELCALHFLISSTVDPWERGDETKICPLIIGKEFPDDSSTFKFIPFIKAEKNRTKVPSVHSRCPVEKGIIQTSWGNISPGTLIAAISAALEPQNVKVQDILMLTMTEVDENIISQYSLSSENNPGAENLNIDFKKTMLSSSNPSSIISNILAATLAGDLAELAIRQGPVGMSNPSEYKISSTGKWNDSFIPRDFYILHSRYGQWEITDAEILAGIDGFIIANYIEELSTKLDRIRLSQIIEMYYSSYGVPVGHRIKACDRKQNMVKHFKDSNIYEQTLNMVNVLWSKLSNVFVTPGEIEKMSNAAVQAFESYWPKLLDKIPNCDVRGDTCSMDAIFVTDGSWTKYETEKMIAILSETLDVSSHGSSLGIMHGNTAEWIAPPSHSILHLFDSVANFTEAWPDRLNLPAILTTLLPHLENKTEEEKLTYEVVGLPHVVIIAAPTTRWSQSDLDRSVKIMETLRSSISDVYFLYLTPDSTAFKKISIDPRTHSDMLIETSNTNIVEVAEMIRMNFISKTIPKRLVSIPCQSGKAATDIRLQYEDYINVGQKVIYRIHPIHMMYIPVVKVQFQGTDQGEISVCLSRKYTEDAAMSCKLVTGQYDATFEIKHPCNGDAFCDPIYFIVRARESLIKCADTDCRYPDQIRFIVRHDGMQCNQSNSGVAVHIHFGIVLAILTFYFLIKTNERTLK